MISARDIAAAVGTHSPTAEQTAVIEAPWDGVYRVIAGAGSGKTETMAQRVVWLVANGYVSPQAVLGLTFTKKAAGELGARIAKRLAALRESGLAPDADEFDAPRVSTYHSFASAVYRDNAVLLGMDPDATVMSEASAWALARSVVHASSLPALSHWDYSLDELTRVVRLLAQRKSDNQVDDAELTTFVEDFARCAELPPGGRGAYADVDGWVQTVSHLTTLNTLVAEYERAKRLRGVIEFSDQVALASTIITSFPHVVGRYRDEHQVVLLDEYQDTSVSQTALLSSMFTGHPVMAVGDPHQAIYGWRGASSANLSQFDSAFGGTVTTFPLSVSWRNGTRILQAANALALPLRERETVDVGELTPGPDASSLPLSLSWSTTVEEEASAVAEWCEEQLARNPEDPPSAALLLRQRAHQRAFVEALRDRGVPVHVLGIGGLLEDPAIADTVCALRVIASPGAESELVRLLAGAKWRIGVHDLHRLSRVRRWLNGRDEYGVAVPDEVAHVLKTSVSFSDQPSLWDALGFVASSPDGHSVREGFTEVGLARLSHAYEVLNSLSHARFSELTDLVHQIETALGLDIEVLAHPRKETYLAARETFFDALQNYTAFAEDATVRGFVQWLDEAQYRDNLTPRSEKAEPGCVQVLTIHGAKGLEWDVVALPRLVGDEMPAAPRETKGWLYRGELPYPLRGDRDSLPHLPFTSATSRKELVDLVGRFSDDNRAHQLREERRLMYVGITRAKHSVLLSGSFFAHHQTHRSPSVFLHELAEHGLVGALPNAPADPTPPEKDTASERLWPADPLGTRRAVVERAAQAVLEATASLPAAISDPSLALALAQQKAATTKPTSTRRIRVSASSLESMASSPEDYQAGLLRPLPKKPIRAALRGTHFHAHVENRWGDQIPTALVDVDGVWGQEDKDSLSVAELIEVFEASEFANQRPLAIEAELHLPLRDYVVVCKMDAVFATETGVHIIDWKTGTPPKTADDIQRKALQLAAYRVAWSEWASLPLDQVQASFWFASTGSMLTPPAFASAEDLYTIIDRAIGPRVREGASVD